MLEKGDTERARELQRKSAKAKKENNIKTKELKKALMEQLNKPVGTDPQGHEILAIDAMAIKAVQMACRGNPKFFELVRDTIGQKPIEKVAMAEISQEDIDEVEDIILRKISEKE